VEQNGPLKEGTNEDYLVVEAAASNQGKSIGGFMPIGRIQMLMRRKPGVAVGKEKS